jgi:ADP-ribose pyrophosphatase YjhB (NUDIX family)
MAYTYAFARPSVTATIVLVHAQGIDDLRVLTGVRGDLTDAFPGMLCLPGGFMDPRVDTDDSPSGATAPGERIEQTAIREIKEETNIDVEERQLKLYHVHSDPTTDPRAHVVNVCYWVSLTDEQAASAKATNFVWTWRSTMRCCWALLWKTSVISQAMNMASK